jgi:hypothetical protein
MPCRTVTSKVVMLMTTAKVTKKRRGLMGPLRMLVTL